MFVMMSISLDTQTVSEGGRYVLFHFPWLPSNDMEFISLSFKEVKLRTKKNRESGEV